jgi:hypothetical protein
LTRRTINKKTSDWFERPWVKLIGALTGIFLLFGTGFTVGIYKNEIDCNLEQMKIRQEFNEKLLNHMTSCQNEKLNKYETIIDNLKNSPNEK